MAQVLLRQASPLPKSESSGPWISRDAHLSADSRRPVDAGPENTVPPMGFYHHPLGCQGDRFFKVAMPAERIKHHARRIQRRSRPSGKWRLGAQMGRSRPSALPCALLATACRDFTLRGAGSGKPAGRTPAGGGMVVVRSGGCLVSYGQCACRRLARWSVSPRRGAVVRALRRGRVPVWDRPVALDRTFGRVGAFGWRGWPGSFSFSSAGPQFSAGRAEPGAV